MSIGVVVPTRDRRENLALLLASLSRQTRRDFTLVVADDGSADGTREMVERQASDPAWEGRLRWVGCGPLGGQRGRARNIGVANLPAGASAVVMLDSDLILQATAMERFAELLKLHPDAVVFGPVDRLPPMALDDVSSYVRSGDTKGLRKHVPDNYTVTIPRASELSAPKVGPDYRYSMFSRTAGQPVAMVRYGPVGNNAGWPLSAVWSLGGMDEQMKGWGHEDLEFAMRAEQTGIECVFDPGLWALHVWHPQPGGSGYEWQRNLDYYVRRHGDTDMEPFSDWSLWFHYHAERGGSVVRCQGTLWLLNRTRDHRLSLPEPGWLSKLGHCGHEIPSVGPDELAAATDHGCAEPGPEFSRKCVVAP